MRVLVLAAVLLAAGCDHAAVAGVGDDARARPVGAAAQPGFTAGAGGPTAMADGTRLAAASDRLPPDFPSGDPLADGSACYLYLMISADAAAARSGSGAGAEPAAMERAAGQWRPLMRQTLSERDVRQFTAGETNYRLQTQAAEREAAARWCIENAPDVAPRG